jgi:hypothetical protein
MTVAEDRINVLLSAKDGICSICKYNLTDDPAIGWFNTRIASKLIINHILAEHDHVRYFDLYKKVQQILQLVKTGNHMGDSRKILVGRLLLEVTKGYDIPVEVIRKVIRKNPRQVSEYIWSAYRRGCNEERPKWTQSLSYEKDVYSF